MMPPPTPIKIQDVPKFLMVKYGLEVTRQTIYNWTKKGRNHDKLQTTFVKNKPTAKHPHVQVTTAAWIDAFILRSGIPVGAAGDQGPGTGADGEVVGS